MLRPDGAGFAYRDVVTFNERLRNILQGIILTLADLWGRFTRYVENTGATDGTVERL